MSGVPEWLPGTEYQPDELVRAPNIGTVVPAVLTNADFESGDTDWDTAATEVAIDGTDPYAGSFALSYSATSAVPYSVRVDSDDRHTVVPGQVVRCKALGKTPSSESQVQLGISFYNSGGSLITTVYGSAITGEDASAYREVSVSATAPVTAATCAPSVVVGQWAGAGGVITAFADNVVFSHSYINVLGTFNYKAVQAAAAFSGEAEPTWPTVLAGTVVDNGVTWEAVSANLIVWQANAILKSGSSEPTWPTTQGAVVGDNTITWVAEPLRITDSKCPHSKQVTIAASKIFAGDDDIVAYSATVNPLDWSLVDDAGYIPFGLNTYGSEPVSALGLYRSNLVAFNNEGFQMWQIDEDPQNFALLDAVPVDCPYHQSLQPMGNDLIFCSGEGIRNIGIAGASTNLEAGVFGKQVDPLVKAKLAAISSDDDMLSLYYPGAGQYWLIFDAEAFVLTMNGGKKDMSWSRYVFPSAIDAWTLKDGDLYLRSGDKVWKFDENADQDDEGGTPTSYEGRVWWPYLDFGAVGQDKEMVGFDTVATGQYDVTFGYDQGDDSLATAAYTITDGDTVVGDPYPFELVAPSIQMRLTFAGNQTWEWNASTLYLKDWRKA